MKPPLTRLPSFLVNAVVLSFFLYEEDARLFLSRLSQNAKQYGSTHRE